MYDNYLARLAQAEEAGITWNELLVLAKVSGGSASSILEDAERAGDLLSDLGYDIASRREMSRDDRLPQAMRELLEYSSLDENWGVDSEKLLSKLRSLPPEVSGALGVRADLHWIDGGPEEKKADGNGEFFARDPVAMTSEGLEEHFKRYGLALVSVRRTTVTPASSIFLEIYLEYLKEFHPEISP